MEKEIAIIIPAYNAHDTIKNLIYSIMAQTI
jgi:glycosyltransferase involved in cell wall biosynthesis